MKISEVKKNYPWVFERGKNCILSPDSDGLLCGLLMSHYLGWKIKGFYDGKLLILEKGLSAKDCVFLDIDIFRKDIKSIGHHMVLLNKAKTPSNWSNYDQCIQPNIMRNYDMKTNFKLKYPLGTIHLLLSIIGSDLKISIPDKAVPTLLYTDGTFKNLFNYPENCLDWFQYLGISDKDNVLNKMFYIDKHALRILMLNLKKVFTDIGLIGKGKRGGDKLYISDTSGIPKNLDKTKDLYNIKQAEKEKVKKFINLLSASTDWEYKDEDWTWENFSLYKFTKGGDSPTQSNYDIVLAQNPLSFVIRSATASGFEYALESPDKLP